MKPKKNLPAHCVSFRVSTLNCCVIGKLPIINAREPVTDRKLGVGRFLQAEQSNSRSFQSMDDPSTPNLEKMSSDGSKNGFSIN